MIHGIRVQESTDRHGRYTINFFTEAGGESPSFITRGMALHWLQRHKDQIDAKLFNQVWSFVITSKLPETRDDAPAVIVCEEGGNKHVHIYDGYGIEQLKAFSRDVAITVVDALVADNRILCEDVAKLKEAIKRAKLPLRFQVSDLRYLLSNNRSIPMIVLQQAMPDPSEPNLN